MTIEELNAINASGGMDEFIRVCEARQVKELSKIADTVCGFGGKRIVLLAGCSSAGKTTTATRLCTQLRVNGFEAMHFSTDDYFVGDKRNPRDENGEFDYEHVDCVDIPRLVSDLNALVRGEAVHMRKFDFRAHDGFDDPAVTSVPADGFIVLEGIHALNPRLTEGLDDSLLFRIFIEPRSDVEVFGHTRIGSRETRLVRRIVRDASFRGMSPSTTFAMWPKVIAGEEKWILPFRGNADAEFNSALSYELAVLRNYAEGSLRLVTKRDPENVQARMLAELLSTVDPVSPVAVPGDSILRETIGGSQLEY